MEPWQSEVPLFSSIASLIIPLFKSVMVEPFSLRTKTHGPPTQEARGPLKALEEPER